jgi:hypothetical protein
MAFYFVSTFAIAQTPTKQPALRLSASSHLRECYEASTEFTMVVAKWHVRRTSGAPKALAVALSFCCLLANDWTACRNAFCFVYTYASATIPTKQRPYAFWGLPALAFALHGWQRLMIIRVKFLLLAWAGMPKTSFRKNSDSPRFSRQIMRR